jgi:hypothetical protein
LPNGKTRKVRIWDFFAEFYLPGGLVIFKNAKLVWICIVVGYATKSDAITFDQWTAQIKADSFVSLDTESIDASKKSTLLDIEIGRTDSPYSVSSTLSQDTARPQDVKDDTIEKNTESFKNTFEYSSNRGLVASIETTSSITESKNTPQPQTAEKKDITSKSHILSGRLSYDAYRHGVLNLGKKRSESDVFQAMSVIQSLESRKVESDISKHRILAGIFAAICKRLSQESVRDLVSETVKQGNLQLEANLISKKNHLNFINLENTVSTRIANSNSNLRRQIEQLAIISPPLAERVTSEMAGIKNCELNIESEEKLLTSTLAKFKTKIKLPSTRSAETSLKSSVLNAELSRINSKPSISPFLSGQWSPVIDEREETGKITLGVTLSWNGIGDKTNLSLDKAKAEIERSKAQLEEIQVKDESRIERIRTDSAAQITLLKILEKSLESSVLLLTTLKSERDIGTVDSLGFTNATISNIDIRESLVGVWQTLITTRYELSRLACASDQKNC